MQSKKAAKGEDEEPSVNFMTRCGVAFNITEMLALIKGDFAKIDNFAPRIKEILSADLKDS